MDLPVLMGASRAQVDVLEIKHVGGGDTVLFCAPYLLAHILVSWPPETYRICTGFRLLIKD